MNELLGILKELEIKSATINYNKLKPAGATLELDKGDVLILINGENIEKAIGNIIAEKIEIYPKEGFYFEIGEGDESEVYYANLLSKEISADSDCTVEGMQKVKEAVEPYPNWTFKE